jgi:hypothetical protein
MEGGKGEMSAIKQAWITDHDANLVALSLESSNVKEKHMRVKAYDMEFPEVPSKNNPLRHTVSISLLDEEDLKKILAAICKYLKYDIEVE